MKVLYDNDTLFEGSMIQDLSKRRNRIHEELCQVSIKFEGQLQKLHAQAPSCEQNPALQERLKKGVAYFDEHLKSIAAGLFDLPFKTDNQAVNEQLTEALKLLKEDIYLKGCCLEACQNGFSVREYQKTKSVKVIETEKIGKKKVEIKDDTMDKIPLYAALSAWRLQKAKEEGMPAYTVAHNKTLKAIAQAKPVTLTALKEVDGMGIKSVKHIGAEILDIVLRFMGEDPASADLGAMPEEPEKKEKKHKGETYHITKEMIDRGMSAKAIAKERGLAISTIYGHLAYLVEQGSFKASQFVDKENYNVILDYFESTFDPSITIAKDVLGEDYKYWEIKLVLAELNHEHFFDNQPNEED